MEKITAKTIHCQGDRRRHFQKERVVQGQGKITRMWRKAGIRAGSGSQGHGKAGPFATKGKNDTHLSGNVRKGPSAGRKRKANKSQALKWARGSEGQVDTNIRVPGVSLFSSPTKQTPRRD